MTGEERPLGLAARALIALVRGYQLLFSSFFGRSCRFYPTCSAYGAESLRRHGAWRGTVLAIWRILRCGPFSRGGPDPVPENFPSLKGLGKKAKTGSDSLSCCANHQHPRMPHE
jgi:putative membrane protein insertion efficiency factor